ncbi:hypothetical protein BDZ89DRAFT_1144156 [Hymenopellis radicata]|nr:hypothetical protein BDZ89DRAFT_1144156 [Hymenopellis radicata]
MYPSQAPRTPNEATQYPGLTLGYTGPIQTSDNYDALGRAVYPPRTHNGLPQQGVAYDVSADPMIQRPPPLLRGNQLAQPTTSNFYSEYARAVPLTSGGSAYMAQQAPTDPATVRAPQPLIQIANGGVDLRLSLPEMAEIIDNRDIVIRCPDGASKTVHAHGHAITLRMASKVVQKWHQRNGGRSGYMLLGFRVDNGVYVAHVV